MLAHLTTNAARQELVMLAKACQSAGLFTDAFEACLGLVFIDSWLGREERALMMVAFEQTLKSVKANLDTAVRREEALQRFLKWLEHAENNPLEDVKTPSSVSIEARGAEGSLSPSPHATQGAETPDSNGAATSLRSALTAEQCDFLVKLLQIHVPPKPTKEASRTPASGGGVPVGSLGRRDSIAMDSGSGTPVARLSALPSSARLSGRGGQQQMGRSSTLITPPPDEDLFVAEHIVQWAAANQVAARANTAIAVEYAPQLVAAARKELSLLCYRVITIIVSLLLPSGMAQGRDVALSYRRWLADVYHVLAENKLLSEFDALLAAGSGQILEDRRQHATAAAAELLVAASPAGNLASNGGPASPIDDVDQLAASIGRLRNASVESFSTSIGFSPLPQNVFLGQALPHDRSPAPHGNGGNSRSSSITGELLSTPEHTTSSAAHILDAEPVTRSRLMGVLLRSFDSRVMPIAVSAPSNSSSTNATKSAQDDSNKQPPLSTSPASPDVPLVPPHHHLFQYPVISSMDDLRKMYEGILQDSRVSLHPHNPVLSTIVGSFAEMLFSHAKELVPNVEALNTSSATTADGGPASPNATTRSVSPVSLTDPAPTFLNEDIASGNSLMAACDRDGTPFAQRVEDAVRCLTEADAIIDDHLADVEVELVSHAVMVPLPGASTATPSSSGSGLHPVVGAGGVSSTTSTPSAPGRKPMPLDDLMPVSTPPSAGSVFSVSSAKRGAAHQSMTPTPGRSPSARGAPAPFPHAAAAAAAPPMVPATMPSFQHKDEREQLKLLIGALKGKRAAIRNYLAGVELLSSRQQT